MSAPHKTVSTGLPGSSFPLMANVQWANGNRITQATVSSISYTAQPVDKSLPVVSGTLDKTAVVFDTLQTDGWDTDIDANGYCFRWNIPSSLVAMEGKEYKIRITFVGTGTAANLQESLVHIRRTLNWNEV